MTRARRHPVALLTAAAVVVGHVDRVMAASGELRWPLAVRWRERLDALLATLPGETLAARRRQGESLRLDQAFSHAFADAIAGPVAAAPSPSR